MNQKRDHNPTFVSFLDEIKSDLTRSAYIRLDRSFQAMFSKYTTIFEVAKRKYKAAVIQFDRFVGIEDITKGCIGFSKTEALDNPKLANDNNPEMFVKSLFPEKFQQIVTACYLENNNSFQKLFNDTDFYKEVMEQMAKELYKALRKK